MQTSGAARLAEYRDRHGLKQYELAQLLELPDAYISQLLSGKRRPGLKISVRIEDKTGIPARSWLLNERSGSKRPRKRGAVPVEIS